MKKISATVKVTVVRPTAENPEGQRIDQRTGESRPLTERELSDLAARDARVARALNREEA